VTLVRNRICNKLRGRLIIIPRRRRGCFLAAAFVATCRCLGSTSEKVFKPTPEVLKVIVTDFEFLHFFDDRLEVREGAYGSQGCSVDGTQQPTCRGKDQCVFYGLQGDGSVIQLSSQ